LRRLDDPFFEEIQLINELNIAKKKILKNKNPSKNFQKDPKISIYCWLLMHLQGEKFPPHLF
jgi:hypothetical protein